MNIYLDNASTTPVLPEVTEQITELSRSVYGNPSSIHYHGRIAKSVIEEARKKVAKILNASIGEIFFTSSATEANNMVLKNAVWHLGIQRIISSPTEHHCVLHTLDYLEKYHNTEIIYLKVDAHGNPDLDQLEMLLKENTAYSLVSLMHGNNEIGTLCDIQHVSDICQKYACMLHCDAVQTIGKLPWDVQKTKVSFLSASAHKFHGPKGVGFVYINQENILPPFIHGGAQERNMRAGTENITGIAGLATALEIAVRDMETKQRHIHTLRQRLKDGLERNFEDIRFNGNQDRHYLNHILSVSFPDTPKADLLVMNLDIAGISASSGSACSSGVEEDSHVLQAIGHDPKRKTIRFSFSHMNSLEEIDYLLQKLEKLTPAKV
jgi:cysteine desulfurase